MRGQMGKDEHVERRACHLTDMADIAISSLSGSGSLPYHQNCHFSRLKDSARQSSERVHHASLHVCDCCGVH